jgi:kynurenine/2-aminoadipate aminotransferase
MAVTSSKIENYDQFLSKTSALRQPSAIRSLQPFLKLPGMISLGGGMPNPGTFPFTKISVELQGGGSFFVDGENLLEALQYSPTTGLPRLLGHLDTLMTHYHLSKKTDSARALCVTTGSQDALTKVSDLWMLATIIWWFIYCLVELVCYIGLRNGS